MGLHGQALVAFPSRGGVRWLCQFMPAREDALVVTLEVTMAVP